MEPLRQPEGELVGELGDFLKMSLRRTDVSLYTRSQDTDLPYRLEEALRRYDKVNLLDQHDLRAIASYAFRIAQYMTHQYQNNKKASDRYHESAPVYLQLALSANAILRLGAPREDDEDTLIFPKIDNDLLNEG